MKPATIINIKRYIKVIPPHKSVFSDNGDITINLRRLESFETSNFIFYSETAV